MSEHMTSRLPQPLSRRRLLESTILIGAATALCPAAVSVALPNMNQLLGRPTATSAALSVLCAGPTTCYVEFGHSATSYSKRTPTRTLVAGLPSVFELTGLSAGKRVYYRLRYRTGSGGTFAAGKQYSFSTKRAPGQSFSFTVQGDTHPERAGKMFNASLYGVTMANIAAQRPDFHILLGDDFSIDPLIDKGQATQANVEAVYRTHREWLSVAGSSVPLFLVNGNHEQAAAYLLDGTKSNPAVLAGNARLKFYPLPKSDGFYSADATAIPQVGLVRDYYAWEWGDALFITLDPYWHSSSAVDNVAGTGAPGDQATGTETTTTSKKDAKTGGAKTTDLWKVGIGDVQYAWFKRTLETSKAKYKFVFAHHVLGTGRGGIEVSTNYEWGGADPKGKSTFAVERPNWELPIHDLMVKHGVSVFFQGHDHIFVHQERDGVVYQSMPNPADDSFTMYNETAYKSGTTAPNSGHVRVTVTPSHATIEYFLAARPQDESEVRRNRQVAHTYSVAPRGDA